MIETKNREIGSLELRVREMSEACDKQVSGMQLERGSYTAALALAKKQKDELTHQLKRKQLEVDQNQKHYEDELKQKQTHQV
jgi:hypothetical protein